MIREGDMLAGKYRVERLLGEGGMGYVVAAIHEQLHQRVAVKFLAPELCENQDAAHRFLREARAAVRIQSEHVARVLDVGELEGGAPYMVMEFLSGNDLAREIQARGRFEIPTAIDYLLQASEAVAEAHSIGLIHRDLKPANLFLTRRPDGTPLVKVLDFGISKALTSESSSKDHPSLTAAQSLLGSPAYMSPEQARRPKTVDTRTDIWAFGVILYEFLTGSTPWHGDHPLEVLTAAVSDPMPSLCDVRADVPRELENVIAKCLAKKPEDRHQSIAELAQALAPFAPAASMSSISRISGILRAAPATDDVSTTLKSFPAEASADTELLPGSGSSASGASGPAHTPQKDTHAGWGTSQVGVGSSRKRVALAAAVGATLLGLAFFWLAPGGPGRRAEEKADATAPAAMPPVVETKEATKVEPSATVVVAPHAEASTVAVASATTSTGIPTPPASASAKPRAVAQPSARPRPAVATQPAQPPVSTAPEDPLDGRR
jgi:eukaryotic-like serine/threonine-protein kinase